MISTEFHSIPVTKKHSPKRRFMKMNESPRLRYGYRSFLHAILTISHYLLKDEIIMMRRAALTKSPTQNTPTYVFVG